MSNAEPAVAAAPARRDRRNARTHRAIIDATLELLNSVRYSNLTIEAIATKAGVGKATVYRWWPSKSAVVAEAMSSTLQLEDAPATDDFSADLVAALQEMLVNDARSHEGVLLAALASDLVDDPAQLTTLLEDFVLPRRRVVTELLERGIREGHIANDHDPDLLTDMWAGAVIYRGLMNHLPIGEDHAVRMVDGVVDV